MNENIMVGVRRAVHALLRPSELPREAGLTARPILVVHDSDDAVARGANVDTKAGVEDVMVKCWNERQV